MKLLNRKNKMPQTIHVKREYDFYVEMLMQFKNKRRKNIRNIWVESKEGKGSTFSFTFSIK